MSLILMPLSPQFNAALEAEEDYTAGKHYNTLWIEENMEKDGKEEKNIINSLETNKKASICFFTLFSIFIFAQNLIILHLYTHAENILDL